MIYLKKLLALQLFVFFISSSSYALLETKYTCVMTKHEFTSKGIGFGSGSSFKYYKDGISCTTSPKLLEDINLIPEPAIVTAVPAVPAIDSFLKKVNQIKKEHDGKIIQIAEKSDLDDLMKKILELETLVKKTNEKNIELEKMLADLPTEMVSHPEFKIAVRTK